MRNGNIENSVGAFDKASLIYDESERNNPILRWMRRQVYEVCYRYFKEGDYLLELNCGTGTDALNLAIMNKNKIFATDASSSMIDKLNEKLQSYSLPVETGVFPFSEIGKLTSSNSFDGVLSNFGGLNCIDDYSGLSKSLSNIKKGGIFIAVVMNRICPWEILFYLLKWKRKEAFRRLNRKGIMADVYGEKIMTYYYSPKQFAGFFKNYFDTVKIYSLGLFTPSPYMSRLHSEYNNFTTLMMMLDQSIHKLYPFNRFGDHFILVMRRK